MASEIASSASEMASSASEMASIGESSYSPCKLADDKPVLVRVKRKAFHSRLDALWLEISERPLKRPLLDFENLSISESFKKDEFKTKKIFVQHVETLRNSEATVDIVQSFVAHDVVGSTEHNIKNEERRRNFKRDIPRPDQLLVKARQEQVVLAKKARFEQIWRSRKDIKDAKDDQLHDMYHVYDIMRVDANEVPKQDHMSLEDQNMLSSYLPLLREFIPTAAEEIESDLSANMIKQELSIDEYVYDYYTMKSDMEIADDDPPNQFPLVQVDDLDLYNGPDDSDYESDDSNAENNPQFDYPDEISEEMQSESSNEESEDKDADSDNKQSSEASDSEEDELLEKGAQLYEDDIYGDFDNDVDSFDYDNDGGNDEGEDWRWSYR